MQMKGRSSAVQPGMVHPGSVTVVGVNEAKAQLSHLLREAAAGGEVLITRHGEPVARLVPAPTRVSRCLGMDRGTFEVPEDFDAPLFDEQTSTDQ
jgi:prevent-host-death family protein